MDESAESRPFGALELAGRRCLLVASAGGHLSQIARLAPLLGVASTSRLVTFDSQQANSLRDSFDVKTIPYIAPRDVGGVIRARRSFANEMRTGNWDAVVSTGSAIAVAALPQAALRRVRAIYIESYSRFLAPSMTGRIIERVPGVETFTQHPEWASRRWGFVGSVIDAVKPPEQHLASSSSKSVFVTLGTIRPYRFDALIDRILQLLPRDADVVWQLGATERNDLPGQSHTQMSASHFRDVAAQAGTVISHAGTGTALELIEMGHRPVLVPRRAERREHIDDHQLQIARDLATRGLVTLREVEQLRRDDFAFASAS